MQAYLPMLTISDVPEIKKKKVNLQEEVSFTKFRILLITFKYFIVSQKYLL